MALVQRAGYCARLAVLVLFSAGCGLSKPSVRQGANVEAAPVASQPTTLPAVQQTQHQVESPLRQVAHQLPMAGASEPAQDDGLFAGREELSLQELIREVDARNPSIQAMAYAWRAAAQRYPQVVRLDDPMFMTMMAPGSFDSNQVQPAYILSGSQKIPWFGKLQTRGQAAQAEAGAAFQDVQDTRLVVAQVTRLAFYDYYLAVRQWQINEENTQSAREFKESAKVKYENNLVTQQDVIQADVELTDLRRRKIELERMQRVAIASINTLLLRSPDRALPPPPQSLPPEAPLPPPVSLRQMAMAQRPDLAALAARVRAEEAAVDLAFKQYYPDAEFFGRYDSFWQPASTQSDLRGQVGVNMNVPIYRGRLNAAVSEAQFRLSQRRAEYQQRFVDIQYQVQSAYEQVDEARRTVELYHQQYLRFAEQNLAVATTNYDVGKTTYLSLVMAQRQLFAVREKHEQALADYYRRLAELERVVGGNLSGVVRSEELPRPVAQ